MQQRNLVLAALSLGLLLGCSDSDGNLPPPSLVFGAPGLFPLAGTHGRDLVFADLNRDGIDDAVVALEGDDQFTWLPGMQPGGFASPREFAAVVDPNVIAVGDLDGDRVPDVVTGSSSHDRVGVSRNLGTGDFAALTLFTLPTPTRDLRILDATGDGRADIVSASATVSELHILPGDGHGTFGAPITVPLAAIPGDLLVADFDGNGGNDLVIASAGGSLVMMLPGTTVSSTDPLAGKLAAGDLDNDGVFDLVVLNLARDGVDSLRGNGAGHFTRVASQHQNGVLDSLSLADFDGDGHLDLVAGAGTEIRISYGLGDGSFGAPEVAGTDPAGVSAVSTRDVNGDGRPDIGFLTAHDELGLLTNPQPVPVGLVAYGTGTPDCPGTIVLTGNSRPYMGNLGFAFVGRNALARSSGVILIGFGQDLAGSDPFHLGIKLHLLLGPELNPRFVEADANGRIEDPYEIPVLPSLVGGTIYAQTLWFGGPTGGCSTSPYGFSSSRGLSLTVQPQ